MEKMFPFLHEDVLYIINEYARDCLLYTSDAADD